MNKITIDRATVEQVLEALDRACQTAMMQSLKARIPKCGEFAGVAQDLDFAITTLRQALEQPNEFNPDWDQIKPFHDRIAELEKVAKMSVIDKSAAIRIATALGWEPKREWVGLTQQDIDIAFDDTQEGGGFDEFARAIEAMLKAKNEY